MEGRTIAGRYTVERAAGRGAMGTVWLCRDDVLGRLVAVKQVGNLPGESASDVNRALREARSSAALDHRNVVSVFDAIEDGDRNWLVMEYVPSRALSELLADEGRITPERATWIGVQAADGLAAAHARGTMHRDVKPGNILVADDDHVKITDFGLSRTHGDAQLTSTGLITGTPAYFAPEIARGEEPGLPADVWALGATLYAAVEGHPPYPDPGNPIALLTTIAAQSAPLPRQAGTLTEAINRMMDRDPAARWSMGDAAHALRRLHLANVGAPGSEPTVTLAAPVLGAAAVGAAVVPEPEPEPAPAGLATERPRPEDDDDRRRGWLLPVAAVLLVAVVLAGVLLLTGNDEDTPTATDPGATSSPEASDPAPSEQPTPEPTPEPTQEPEPSEEPSPEPEPEPEAPVGGDVEAFGEGYYGLLPDDTEAAYALLSPSYGSSFEEYDGFWRTIGGVEVRGVTAVDDTTVDVDITYVDGGGGTQDETRRLFLEPTDGGYVIVSDAAV